MEGNKVSLPIKKDVLSLLGWIPLATITVVAILFVLVPFYGSGGHYPSVGPGWYPDRPDEVYSISRFEGTIWSESEVLQDLFWYVGCWGWCLYFPAWAMTLLIMLGKWVSFPGRIRQTWFYAFSIITCLGISWFVASMRLATVGD